MFWTCPSISVSFIDSYIPPPWTGWQPAMQLVTLQHFFIEMELYYQQCKVNCKIANNGQIEAKCPLFGESLLYIAAGTHKEALKTNYTRELANWPTLLLKCDWYIHTLLFLMSKTLLSHFFWLCPSFLSGFFAIFEEEKSARLCMSLFLTENPLFFTNLVPIFGALRLGRMYIWLIHTCALVSIK